jgi:tRNA threonylcarbamoyladenosine biosynthesis protein TsaB
VTLEGLTLGIDTAGGVAAAVIGSDLQGVSTTETQALEGLLLCVRRALAAVDHELSAVHSIAVCVGPGSFTGLRIGVAFAKSLAQALGVSLLGISSFDIVTSIRAAAEGAPPRMSIVEGKRGFYYARIATANDGGTPITFSGDRSEMSNAALGSLGAAAGELEVNRALAAVACDPGLRAVTVAKLGRAALDAGASGDWRRLAIEYGQRPNAVVNWELRHGSS